MKAIPASFARQARQRVARTRSDQDKVLLAIKRSHPLDAEDDEVRKIAYLQNTLGVSAEMAGRVAKYEDPKELDLTPVQKSLAESIQGKTVDFLPACFLELARAAAQSVARVATPSRVPEGSGFMISPNLFLTNHHVIGSAAQAKQFYIEFNYEVDFDLKTTAVTRFALDPATLFLFDDEDDLDFALIAVGPRVDGKGSLSSFGYLPLMDSKDKHVKSMFVNVVQHPEGRPKQLVLRENRILARTENTLIYGTDTMPGSSGSPVLNDDWETVALHHWGEPHRAINDPGDKAPGQGNEGIRVSAIVKHLRDELSRLSGAKASLLKAALNPPTRRPSLAKSLKTPKLSEGAAGGGGGGSGASRLTAELGPDGSAIWSMPLVFSVRVGEARPAAADADNAPAADETQ